MTTLYNGNCIDEMSKIADNSVDLIYTDLPYATNTFGKCTDCKWDKPIDLDKMWAEFMRIKKLHTPIFMSCNVKLGFDLMSTCPKKCPFRYDLIWIKGEIGETPCKTGFLHSKRQPLRSHELVYVFYERQPFYDLSSHPYTDMSTKNGMVGKDNLVYSSSVKQVQNKKYDPPLPNSLLHVKSERGKHSTQKPLGLMEWILKYYSKEDDVVVDCCMGSGSMGVACKESNRQFIGIELNPEIYEDAQKRMGL